ncbi:hypothetical protein PINS_up010240 [Pythium insidiosum]|nr:hypothetical protein PINS_up010240 [Pythium insidiosum]
MAQPSPGVILVRSPTGFSSSVAISVTPPVRPLTRIRSRACWVEAMSTVIVIVRNAVLAVLVAWATTYVSARGNVLSGRSVAQQSYNEFLFATFFWTQVFYCFTGTWMQAATLLRHRFQSRPNAYPTLVECFARVARRGLPYYMVVVGIWLSMARIFSTLKPSTRVRRIKLEYYLHIVGSFVYTIGMGIIGRHIFKFETVEGHQRLQRCVSSTNEIDHSETKKPSWIPSRVVQHLVLFGRFFYVRFPMILCVELTSVYTQVMSSRRLQVSLDIYVVTFTCLAVKICVQELAKRAMLRKVKHVRTMFLAVAMPTVLIDTQLRVVLQRLDSTQLTITGTALLAACEIVMRIAKTLLVRVECHRLDTQWKRQCVSVAPTNGDVTHRRSQGQVEAIKAKLMAFHSAELFSDMLAEYIAMGCSTAALFFYWDHPKYHLGHVDHSSGTNLTSSPASSWTQHQSTLLIVQVIAEMVVDTASCAFELSLGVSFHEIRRHGTYLVLLSVVLAVINTFVTASIYIRND